MSVCMDWEGGEAVTTERSAVRSARYSSTRSSWLTSPGLGSWVSQAWMLVTCSRLRYLCCCLGLVLAGVVALLLAGAGLGAACQLHSGSEQTFLRNNLSLGTLMDTDRPRILTQTFFLSPILLWAHSAVSFSSSLISCLSLSLTSYHSDSWDASGHNSQISSRCRVTR